MIFGIFGKFRIDIGVQKNFEMFFRDEKFFSKALVSLDKGSEKTDPNGAVAATVQAALPAKTFLLLTARLVIPCFRFVYNVGVG